MGSNHAPRTRKELHLPSRQEETRKDPERLLGCLQGRIKILRRESLDYNLAEVVGTSEACVIIHKMLVELRLDGYLDNNFDEDGKRISEEDVVTEFIKMLTSSIGDESMSDAVDKGQTHVVDSLISTVNVALGVSMVITDKGTI